MVSSTGARLMPWFFSTRQIIFDVLANLAGPMAIPASASAPPTRLSTESDPVRRRQNPTPPRCHAAKARNMPVPAPVARQTPTSRACMASQRVRLCVDGNLTEIKRLIYPGLKRLQRGDRFVGEFAQVLVEACFNNAWRAALLRVSFGAEPSDFFGAGVSPLS